MKIADSPIRLLLVDDDELSRELLTLQISTLGYEVSAAESGSEALRLLEQEQVMPDVILTDLQMPGISGSALAKRLRDIATAVGSPGMILVAMSGSLPREDLKATFDSFLLKPFTMRQLAEAIASLTRDTLAPLPSDKNSLPTSQAPALDDAVYQKLAASMPLAQLKQLYTLCLDDAALRIDQMRASAEAGDDAAFRREAHAIKGGCGWVGATEIQRLADAAEKSGLEPANHVASLGDMMIACERLRRILVEYGGKATE